MSSLALVKTIFIIGIGLLAFNSGSGSFANAEELNFSPIKFRNCKSRFEILSVEVTECGGDEERCIFRRNSEETIRIGFKPDRTVNDLKTMVFANLGDASGALTKFHLENDQTCQGNNITCPLEDGKTYYYSQSVRILPEYPTIDVQVNWLLTDTSTDNKESEGSNVPTDRDVCIKFLATVKE